LRQSASGASLASPEEPDLRFAGASSDLRHIVFSTCAALSADETEVPDGKNGCNPAAPNLYEWGEGQLTLLNVLPDDSKGTPGATLGAPAGAVSADGSRVYFSVGEDGPSTSMKRARNQSCCRKRLAAARACRSPA
jgi:hypothetical protein